MKYISPFSHTLLLVESERINFDGRRAVYRHPFLAHAEFTVWMNTAESPGIWSIWLDGDEAWRGSFEDVCLFLDVEVSGASSCRPN